MCKSQLYQTLVTTSFLANFCDQVNMCVNIYFKALQLWLIPFLLPTSIIKHTDGNAHIEHTDRNGHICYTHFRIIYEATPIYGWVGGGRRPKLLCRALPRSTHFLPCKPNLVLGSDPQIPSCSVLYCPLANKHVTRTTDALAYHCLKHNKSTLLR